MSARLRRFYWRHVRRYRYEICWRAGTRRGCGRPVGVVWRAPSGIWNYVVAGQQQTVYTVREGAAGGPVEERAEGLGGILCLQCFDDLAQECGVPLRWESRPL